MKLTDIDAETYDAIIRIISDFNFRLKIMINLQTIIDLSSLG